MTSVMKLRNSYFMCEQEPYEQTFGCAMGFPVRANQVMEFVEESAISTAAHPPTGGTDMGDCEEQLPSTNCRPTVGRQLTNS